MLIKKRKDYTQTTHRKCLFSIILSKDFTKSLKPQPENPQSRNSSDTNLSEKKIQEISCIQMYKPSRLQVRAKMSRSSARKKMKFKPAEERMTKQNHLSFQDIVKSFLVAYLWSRFTVINRTTYIYLGLFYLFIFSWFDFSINSV